MCTKRGKRPTTVSGTGEFLNREVCYENLNTEKPVPGCFPHLKDNALALSYSSLGSGGIPEMCLRSPFAKSNLEISPLTLSFSSRMSGGRVREYRQEALGWFGSLWIALGASSECPSPDTFLLTTEGMQVPWRTVQGCWGVNLVWPALARSLHLSTDHRGSWQMLPTSIRCECIALPAGVPSQDP